MSKIPDKLWEGGPVTATVNVIINQPSTISASFSIRHWSEKDEDWIEDKSLSALQKIEPGRHTFPIQMKGPVEANFEIEVTNPTPGASIEWSIHLDGRLIHHESDRMDSPLEPGTAFFVQAFFDDLATGTFASD